MQRVPTPWTLGYCAVRRHVLGSRSRAHAADAKNFVTVRTACGACALGVPLRVPLSVPSEYPA